MHQPCYAHEGEFLEPWTYLHAAKDYADMAAHIEAQPGARAVVNFVPVLLEQLDLYRERTARLLGGEGWVRDELLDTLGGRPLPAEPEARLRLARRCLDVNERHVLGRFPEYMEIAHFLRLANADNVGYLSDALLYDAVTWMHLGWLGEHRLRGDVRAQALLAKGRGFDAEERRSLLELIGLELDELLPRYRRLQEQGRVELAMSPWGHPIMPLLLDFEAARGALPDVKLPEGSYPGGEDRVRWHLQQGLAVFERFFHSMPSGCWPSEGALCSTSARLLAEAGFRWTASGGGVLQNTLLAAGSPEQCVHTPYTIAGGTDATGGEALQCFFRDDGLSDLIGFTYKDWGAGDAVADLIGHLEQIGRNCERPNPVVAIIMDGENAWEHYPHNGYEFLDRLYRDLSGHPELHLTTFSEYLTQEDIESVPLERLVPGSWVYGTLSTWIGDPDKNRAWRLLQDAKATVDAALQAGTVSDRARLERALGACEGSDWCWWLGEHAGGPAVQRFDALYRRHLASLYEEAGAEPDPALDQPISRGGGGMQVGSMRPSKAGA